MYLNVEAFSPKQNNIKYFSVCFIKPPFTLLSQSLSQLYNGSFFQVLNLFCIRFLACFRYVNYCVPLAVVQVTLIIRRGDGQWVKSDKLIVSVADYFNEAIFTAPTVSKECRFQKGFGGI